MSRAMQSAGEEPHRRPTLSRTIFIVLFAVSLCVIVAATVAVAAVCFSVYEGDAEELLLSQTQATAETLERDAGDDDMIARLESMPFVDVRCTLIGSDGTVLYDNWEDASLMGNHADREEVAAALQQSQATVLRRSETLGSDALYAAVLLDGGDVLRLSETRTSLPSFLGSMAAPLAVSLVVLFLISLWATRLLTRRVVKPLQEIDLTRPRDNDAYAELQPLLERIDAQYRELETQNDELARANNMRREFTGNVSHEMKTPLQVIGGYAELMEGGMVPPDDIPRIAGLIRTEARSMRELIDDVLTLSRLDEMASSQGEPVDLEQVCREAVSRLESAAAERNESVQLACGCRAVVRGSAQLYMQLVYNLVDNAVRYNREGGLVLISVTSDDEHVTLEVSDEGPGIAPMFRERVFERFFRVDSSRSRQTGGTGLGLAIVKHAAEAFGGEVHVCDSACGGACFVAALPVWNS